MGEIIEKIKELQQALENHNEVITVTVKKYEDNRAEILVNSFTAVPAGKTIYEKMSDDIGGYSKNVIIDGVKIHTYGTAEMVVNELKGETK